MSTLERVSTREAVERASARRRRRERARRWLRFGLIVACVLIVDQALKAIVRATMVEGDSIHVFPGLDIVRITNEGIAFGLFPGRQSVVAVLTVVALCGIAIALAGLGRRNALVVTGGALLMGGSLGNLTDRLAHGGVTDFIDPAAWPAFNAADVAIIAGAVIVVLGLTQPAPEGGRDAG
ncbi:MAG TPA: signal peptidase II [Miltoncostaeaceae bacterium]|nr:signal peptidase II [Miltoncostaeaceae bacterium]